MDVKEIHKCFEILNESPGWFFKKEIIAKKVECLEKLKQATGDIVYRLMPLLTNQDKEIRNKTAETVLVLFDKQKSKQGYEAFARSVYLTIKDIEYYTMRYTGDTLAVLLCIASLNSDGYVRQKAVKEIAILGNPAGIKFILLRLNDWVKSVSAEAENAIEFFFSSRYHFDFIRLLPFIMGLTKTLRVDLTNMQEKIMRFIATIEFSDSSFFNVLSLPDNTRFLYYKCISKHTIPSQIFISNAIKDRYFLVRIEVLKLLNQYSEDFEKQVLSNLMCDPSAQVRAKALLAGSHLSSFFEKIYYDSLCDEAANVRAAARHLLKNNNTNFNSFYADKVNNNQNFPGSLFGLAEFAKEKDLPVFEKYIAPGNSKIIIVSLSVINRLNIGKATKHALTLFEHPVKKVNTKAIEILLKNNQPYIISAIREKYTAGNRIIKQRALSFYSKTGGWQILSDLLLALLDKDGDIRSMGWQMLYPWREKAVRLFTTASSGDIVNSNKILDTLAKQDIVLTANQSRLLKDIRFFIRS